MADEGQTGTIAALRSRLAELLAAHDRPAAVRLAVEAVTSRTIDIPTLYREVLVPVLVATGAGWQHGRLAVWEEHLATSVVRTIVEILYPGVLKAKAAAAPVGRSVLLACPPEEGHDLGLRMLSDRFDIGGWTTYYLGADTPIEEIADAAARLGVDAVVLSSSTHFHRVALRRYVDFLREQLPHADVWVGGAAFAHDAEGWSRELIDVDAVLAEAAARAAESREWAASLDEVVPTLPATEPAPPASGDPVPAAEAGAPAASDERRAAAGLEDTAAWQMPDADESPASGADPSPEP